MSNLQRRGDYSPRRVREQRAYRLVIAGGSAAAVTVVTLILAVAGAIGPDIPIIAFVAAVICLMLFRRTVGQR